MNHFEKAIEALLCLHFEEVRSQVKTDWKGLFNQNIKVDFLFKSKGIENVLEVKYQEVKGTADQKLVFAIEQIKQCHQIPTYLLIGGVGWSKGAINWAKSQESAGSFLSVLTIDEFLGWVKNG